MRLTDDLHLVDGVMGANVYVILGSRPTLVDAGMPRQAGRILAHLDRLGLQPAQLEVILLTHHDIDHIGSAAALQRATGASVWAPEGDTPYILGTLPRHGLKRYLPGVLRPFLGPLEPVRVDRRLTEGDEVPGGFRVVATPGHTPGHISLHRPGVLIAGDLLQTPRSGGGPSGGRLRASSRAMSWDLTAVHGSLREVAALPCDIVLAGHGAPVLADGGRLLEELVRSLPAG